MIDALIEAAASGRVAAVMHASAPALAVATFRERSYECKGSIDDEAFRSVLRGVHFTLMRVVASARICFPATRERWDVISKYRCRLHKT